MYAILHFKTICNIPVHTYIVLSLQCMNTLDVYILIPVLGGLLIGLFRGLVRELISLLVVVLGISLATLLSKSASQLLIAYVDISEHLAQPVAFAVIFLLVFIALNLLSKILQRLIKALSLGAVNAIAGGVFGMFKMALLVSVFFTLTDVIEGRMQWIPTPLKDNSLLYKPVKKLAPFLWQEMNQTPIDDGSSENETPITI